MSSPRYTQMICGSKWLCRSRCIITTCTNHYCECGGELHAMDSERGKELVEKREALLKSSPRFRRVHGFFEIRKPLPMFDIGADSTDYIPQRAMALARR